MAARNQSGSIDDAFTAFARRRDPDALAAVFDHAAPRLLLVAMHLTRDVADAEDLVQTTFLDAIRGAERFGDGRPVMPWLVTILTRRATDLRRRRRPVGEAGAPVAACEPEPVDEVAQRETIQQIAGALDRLPEPYHEVLTLRFVHGLKVVEIARALRRPVGTVHAQVHRGLAMLRRALPKTVALSAALLATGGERGLAAVRAAVLDAVPAAAPAGVAAWLGARALLVAAGVLAVSVSVLALRGGGSDAPARSSGSAAVATSSRDAETERSQPERDAVPRPVEVVTRERTGAPEPDPDDPDAVRFTGRCVAVETGEPLAGVTIWFRQSWREERYARMTGGAYELVEEKLVTGVDGRFSFAARLIARTDYSLLMMREDRVRRAGRWADLDAVRRFELSDVPMHAGARMTGRLVDAGGKPFAGGVRVDAYDPSLYRLGDGESSGQLGVGFAEDDGVFRSANSAIPVGTWELRSSAGAVLSPRTVTVAAGTREVEATVRVDRRLPLATLSGTLVDPDGAPIEGVLVGAWPAGRSSSCDRTRTDAEGGFALRLWREEDRGDVRLDVAENVPHGYRVHDAAQRVAWGARDVELIADRPMTVDVDVVEAGTGSPLTRYGLHVGLDDGPAPLLHVGTHADGRTRLQCAAPGELKLTVLPERRDLRITSRTFAVDSTTTRLRFELDGGAPVAVRVIDGSGPVAGVEVFVIQGVSWYRDDDGTDPPLADRRALFGSVFDALGRHPFDDRATADADGTARVRVALGRPDQGLFVRGPTIRPRAIPFSDVDVARGVIDVRVESAGRISGVVIDPELARSFATHVEAVPVAGGEHAASTEGRRTRRARIEPDGAFDLSGLEPGRWRLGYHPHALVSDPCVEVDLEDGQECRVELDPARLQPGHVQLQVTFDGVPAAPATELHLYSIRETNDGQWDVQDVARSEVDQRRTIVFETVPPGSYHLMGQRKVLDRWVPYFSRRPVVVEPGAEVRGAFDLVTRELRVVLRDAEGRVVPPEKWMFSATWGGETRDATGRTAMLDPVRGVSIWFDGEDLGPFRLPDGKLTHELEVTVPR